MDKVEFAIAFDRLERSPKQKDVLLKFLAGQTDADIARELGIETGTVRKQLSGICKTFGLKGSGNERRSRRTDLIAIFSQFKPDLLGNTAPYKTQQIISSSRGNSNPIDSDILGSHIYIERPPIEAICYQEILRPYALIRIKGSSQVGKTELLKRVITYAEQQGFLSVQLNLLLADSLILRNLDSFLRWICVYISRKLEIPSHVEEFWDASLSSSDNCTYYLDEHILININYPVVIGFDNVDYLSTAPEIAADFFGLLRAWHENGKLGNNWEKLRLVVSHSGEACMSLQNCRSLFNVGLPVELPEFNREQVKELAKCYGIDWNLETVEQLMDLIGGNPTLIHLVLRHNKACSDFSITDFLESDPTELGLLQGHLYDQYLKLQKDPDLLGAMSIVINSPSKIPLNSSSIYQLERMGLIRISNGLVEPRCNLYKNYFRRHLSKVQTSENGNHISGS